MKEMKLEDLKLKSPTEMLSFAEETGVDISKIRKSGPPKPPILPGATEVAGGDIGPLVPEPA